MKRKSWMIGIMIVAILSVSFLHAWNQRKTLESGIRIHVVDVGQGDCMIVETSDGHVMIDTGSNTSESALRGYLKSHGLDRFSYLILSHPHDDHIGNADMILREFAVERILCAETQSTEVSYSDMKQASEDAMRHQNTEWIKPMSGNVYWVGELRIEILYVPPKDNMGENGDSMIVRLDYGENSVLLMGDAEASDENRLLESVLPDRLPADLLKVAHHGSSGSSTDVFLYAVSPRIAVISAGEGNTFGHPHWEVLSRLQALNAEIYRTDIHGSLIFYCDGRNIHLQP